MRNKNNFETSLPHGPGLSFKAYKTYITAMFTHFKLYKSKYLQCSFKL